MKLVVVLSQLLAFRKQFAASVTFEFLFVLVHSEVILQCDVLYEFLSAVMAQVTLVARVQLPVSIEVGRQRERHRTYVTLERTFASVSPCV